MKASLSTEELIGQVISTAKGLRTERRLSHVHALDIPTYPKPLFVTDSMINIAPGLAEKREICQNAIDLARWLGIPAPKVAVLAAVETINPKIARQLASLADALSAGIVLGARVPIALMSRGDDRHSWLASAALVQIVAHMYRPAVSESQSAFLTPSR